MFWIDTGDGNACMIPVWTGITIGEEVNLE
jgi:hypothetical protein